MAVHERRPRLAVTAFGLLNLVYVIGALALSSSLWRYHPSRGVAVALVLLLWLAAIVVWRRRWAWALMLLFVLAALLSPIWGKWNGGVPFAVNLLSLGLLLSPGMRRWVGVRRVGQGVPHRSSERPRLGLQPSASEMGESRSAPAAIWSSGCTRR